nr:calmodulin-binding transcription activator 1-like isoform X2 [Danio rerio]|eukprot:XP_021329396.1 calmodulin-binding transcription activator 1-like isoform X2 [Danio rerio]
MAAENKPEDEHGHLKIYLPKKLLECLPKCSTLPKERHRWNTNEEIAAYLITFEKHEEWLTTSPKTRPQNGSMILYNRKKVKYRKDGYCWKKRKDGKTTREDHMKLKVQGVEVRLFVRTVAHTNTSTRFRSIQVHIMGALKKKEDLSPGCERCGF